MAKNGQEMVVVRSPGDRMSHLEWLPTEGLASESRQRLFPLLSDFPASHVSISKPSVVEGGRRDAVRLLQQRGHY